MARRSRSSSGGRCSSSATAGYEDFRIVDYSEGIESSTPFTHRYSEGTIQLVRAINEQR
jgi:hypothetical protein